MSQTGHNRNRQRLSGTGLTAVDTTDVSARVAGLVASAALARAASVASGGLAQGEAGSLLPSSFFCSRDTVALARALVGTVLCRRLPEGAVVRAVLTEVEAYDGPEDKACHAHKGRTGRTEVLFGPPAHFYVYLCYGMHWLLNIVTGPVDYPAAILIRGAGTVTGPGRLTRALQIDNALNTLPVSESSGLWIEEPARPVAAQRIIAAPRIGIAYAGPDWANRPYRFTLAP